METTLAVVTGCLPSRSRRMAPSILMVDGAMTVAGGSTEYSPFWGLTAVPHRQGGVAPSALRALLIGGFLLVVLGASSCGETSSGRAESAAPTGSSSSLTSEPSPSTPPVVIRLAVAASRYEGIVAQYQALYENPSDLSRAFGLLKPMKRAFQIWVRTARTAIDEQTVQIPRDALRQWTAAFGAWLDNQVAQRDALVQCADGRPITEITLIRCLHTIGPLVHRGHKLSSKLNALLDSEPTLADLLPELRF
jgi:hypothetical protein